VIELDAIAVGIKEAKNRKGASIFEAVDQLNKIARLIPPRIPPLLRAVFGLQRDEVTLLSRNASIRALSKHWTEEAIGSIMRQHHLWPPREEEEEAEDPSVIDLDRLLNYAGAETFDAVAAERLAREPPLVERPETEAEW
jgi:hypothetical protein